MANPVFGDVVGGAVDAYGYYQLIEDLKKMQSNTTSDFNNVTNTVTDTMGFTPWGVTSGYGGVNATDTGINYALSPNAQNWTTGLEGNAFMELLAANQGIDKTQNSLFADMQAAMAPENQRTMDQMNQQLYNSGRSNMTSQAFGGTPEQLAYAKALQEQQASNWLQAGTTARSDVMDAYTRGLGYLDASYDPTKMLMSQGEQGLTFSGNNMTMNQQLAGLLADLGLGKSVADTNYSAITADATSDMFKTGSDLLSGTGNSPGLIDQIIDFDWSSIFGGL